MKNILVLYNKQFFCMEELYSYIEKTLQKKQGKNKQQQQLQNLNYNSVQL